MTIIPTYLKAVLASKIALVTLCIIFSYNAYSQSPSIDLNYQDTPLSKVLIELAQKSGYDISFNESYFYQKTISCNKINLTVNAALAFLLEGTEVDFQIKGTDIQLIKY